MNIHNLMEEFVFTEVNELFNTAEKANTPWLTCSCSQCRLDTICYVLNRIPPRYIKSGRGLAYLQIEEAIDKSQLSADINKIALEGMKQVLSSQRPHTGKEKDLPKTPVFNFPTFVGRILDGKTFEPAKNLQVELYLEGIKAESIDSSWDNPYAISEHTPGTYTFWVRPQSTTKNGEKKVYSFEIRIRQKEYEPINHFFEVGVTSEPYLRTAYSAEHSFIIPDLHLFKADAELDDMQN